MYFHYSELYFPKSFSFYLLECSVFYWKKDWYHFALAQVYCARLFDILFFIIIFSSLLLSVGLYSLVQYFCTLSLFPEYVFRGVGRLSGDIGLCHGFSERKYLNSISFRIQQISTDCPRFFNWFIFPPKKVDISNKVRAGWIYICLFLLQRSFHATYYDPIPGPEVWSAMSDDDKPGPTPWNRSMIHTTVLDASWSHLQSCTVVGELWEGISCATWRSSLWGENNWCIPP